MGTTALRQLLKSLCSDSHWTYAVLWKPRHHGGMILTWEDGYCDRLKPREPIESISGDIYGNDFNKMLSSHCETSICDGGSGGYPVGLLVDDMSHLQYALGEGVVGEVSYTGNHCWVCLDDIFAEVNSKLVPECPEEWLFQFASGIKTILLVPVLPHGVLQLGSLKAVAEDLVVVAYVRDRLKDFHNVGGNTVPFTFNRDTTSSLMSSFMEIFDHPSAMTISPLKSADPEAVESVKLNKNDLSSINQVVPLLTVQDEFQVPGINQHQILKSANENKGDLLPVDLVEVSTPLLQPINDSEMEIVESQLFRLSCLKEELQAYSQCINHKVGIFGESFNGIINSDTVGDIQLFGNNDVNDMEYNTMHSFLSFPEDCELHKALGPAFQRQTNEFFGATSFPVEGTCKSSSLICNRDLTNIVEPPRFANWGDPESLLDAVVANAYSCSDDTSSGRSNSIKSSTISSGQFAASFQPKSQSEASALLGNDSVPWSQGTSAFVAGGQNAFTTSSTSFGSMMSTLIDEERQEKECGYVQPRKGPKLSNVSKRRARPGDNQRPRPRDRQMIQDRVKELRELVPNGAKCSIDGLLDRTIKHMLYLRGVTDQAEKLRQWVHKEVAACKNRRSSETKDNCQNGISWAFEFGSEHHACPIVVEDLVYPGHMLIEMLCNEHGLFLEIAQVIRSLDLTILKGIMESRSNNTWAHFIVEASKGFHRMDIFWPLMQLWQRNRNPISSKI